MYVLRFRPYASLALTDQIINIQEQYKIKNIQVLNVGMQYLYAGTLAATFLLSMGNRPVGAKWKYMAGKCLPLVSPSLRLTRLSVMIIFSVLTTYMMCATVFCLVRSFQTEQTGGVYAQLIISLASTYGVYVLSSLLALDPWHL